MKLRTTVRSMAVMAVALGGLQAATGPSGAAETTSLQIINNFQYSANDLLGGTVCFDGEVVASGDFVGTGLIETTPGTHELTVFVGIVTDDCDVPEGVTQAVELLDVDAQTLAYGYPGPDSETGDPQVWQFEDDLTCTPAGQGRVTFRHLGYTTHNADFGYEVDGAYTPLAGDISFGDEETLLLEADTYPTLIGRAGGEDFVSLVEDLSVTEQSYQVVYSFAGADGPIGIIVTDPEPVDPCDEPSETTQPTETTEPTVTTTTTDQAPAVVTSNPAPAPGATAVAAQPAYTG